MQSSNKNEVIEGLRNVGLFLLIAILTAVIGGSNQPGWIILFLPVTLGAFAYFVSGKGGKYGAFGVGIGLIASLLWYFFGV